MVKHFLLSFFVRAKKLSGPACNAGAFLATSLCKQRSSIQTAIGNKKGPPQAERALYVVKLEIALVGDGSNLGVAVAGVSVGNQTTASKV